jgi:predicted phage tail protein
VAVAAVVVVAAAVVGGAVVVGTLVVVGRAAVVGGAVVAGGAVAAEVGAAVGAGARAARVVLVVGWRTVLSGVPTLSPPAAATATVVEAGHGRPSQLPGGAGLPKA